MKKSAIIVVLILMIAALFIFQNLYTLFVELESTNLAKIKDPRAFTANIKKVRQMFSTLSLMTTLMIIGAGIYLGIQFRKPRNPEVESIQPIPPLQEYLLQLKGSETQLKEVVEKQQAQVSEVDELNKSIINNIGAAVILLNKNRRINIFNSAAQELFSQSFVNAINNLPGSVFSRFPEIVSFLDSHADEEASEEIHSDGRFFTVLVNPIENTGQLAMIRDVTEEKRKEEFERRNGNFIMLGEMAAFLAHEVRNSLGVIYGYTKTIKSEKEKTKTEKVNKEINFLTTMMENFLNFSKPAKVSNPQPVDLAELFQSAAGETGIELKIIPGESDSTKQFETDPAAMHSIISNLLLNAKEAEAKEVTVSFGKIDDETFEISLTDNGTGIPDDAKEKIWLPFFTTKDKGTGMGLAIIRKLINSLKGEIEMAETGPDGTTFRILFYLS